jgi:hypothetical protein
MGSVKRIGEVLWQVMPEGKEKYGLYLCSPEWAEKRYTWRAWSGNRTATKETKDVSLSVAGASVHMNGKWFLPATKKRWSDSSETANRTNA